MNNEELIIGLLTEMKAQVNSIDERLTSVEGAVIRIENEHGAKLKALSEGQQQITVRMDEYEAKNASRHMQLQTSIDRIETEVSKHEEVILRRLP